jgi:hypothetical protein
MAGGVPELKALATDDITRLCIETRKDQIEKLQWTIKPRDEKNKARNAEAHRRAPRQRIFMGGPNGAHPGRVVEYDQPSNAMSPKSGCRPESAWPPQLRGPCR